MAVEGYLGYYKFFLIEDDKVLAIGRKEALTTSLDEFLINEADYILENLDELPTDYRCLPSDQ